MEIRINHFPEEENSPQHPYLHGRPLIDYETEPSVPNFSYDRWPQIHKNVVRVHLSGEELKGKAPFRLSRKEAIDHALSKDLNSRIKELFELQKKAGVSPHSLIILVTKKVEAEKLFSNWHVQTRIGLLLTSKKKDEFFGWNPAPIMPSLLDLRCNISFKIEALKDKQPSEVLLTRYE